MSDDALLFDEFAPEQPVETPDEQDRWKILIVDDEEGVHTVTELALDRVRFAGRGLTFLHAYSGEEAKTILADTKDIAVVLLDVVMETDDAGLRVADYIREEVGNREARIILRTGQPGQAPEEDVVVRYDINSYKEKTELTARKLFSTIYTALRSYRDIVALERNRHGLEKVIEASASLMEKRSVKSFSQGVLEQLSALLYLERDLFLLEYEGLVAEKDGEGLHVLAHVGNGSKSLDTDVLNRIYEALNAQTDVEKEDCFIRYIGNRNGVESILYVGGDHPLEMVDGHILNLFCRNAAVAFDNVRLNTALRDTQEEIVYSLCEVAETRSKETGNHVRRVAHYSKLIAEELGPSPQECEELFLASPLHDIGKIGIPDAVLNKPGKLDADEWVTMQTHATIGERILARSKQPIIKAASIVAGHHHENWDGSGYPHGGKGEEIPIYGRIVALADVFDALASKRCYKEAWAISEIKEFISSQSRKKFDPQIVDIFERRQSAFEEILWRYNDEMVASAAD